MATTGIAPAREQEKATNGTALKQTMTVREVLRILVYAIVLTAAFVSLRVDVANLKDAVNQMREELHEQRQMIEKLLSKTSGRSTGGSNGE